MTKQLPIPGTERKVHKDITKAAEAYVDARDERQRKSKTEKEKKTLLIAAMKKHELETYIDEDAEIVVTYTADTKEQVKVRELDDDEDGEEAESVEVE